MILKVNNNQFDYWDSIEVTLRFDSVASSFSFSGYFNPNNPDHRELYRPLSYHAATIEYEGQRLITGTLITPGFSSEAQPQLATLAGYSVTGVLEDCEIPTSAYPLQNNGVSLKQIADKLCKPFGIKVVVDAAATKKANETYTVSTADHKQSVKATLAELASQKNLVLTHDAMGNLLITIANTAQQPVYNFIPGNAPDGTQMRLSVDGQRMHSSIHVIGQPTVDNPNARQSTVTNPYVSTFRPRIVRQTSSNNNDAQPGARNYLSEELKAIKLNIDIVGWVLGGSIIRPGSIITVKDPALYLYNTTRFFVEEVTYHKSANEERATITCVLPECYNNETPKNIFA